MQIEKAIKQSRFHNSHEKLAVNLIFTSNWLRDWQNTLLKQFDILPQHYNILRILKGKHPNPLCPGDIKEVMLDKGTDVTRLLDKLVQKGWVNRSLCEENRRKMDVHITEKGIGILKETEEPMKQIFFELKNRLTEEEAEQMSLLLDKMRG